MGRAVIREPKAFFHDEPLPNLDARLRVAMRVEIRKLHQRLGATYVSGFTGSPGLNLLNGIADSQEGIITLSDGQKLAYDRGRWPDVWHVPVIAGFRAEAVHFGGGKLTARFESAEERGAVRLMHGAMAGQGVVAYVASPEHLSAGNPFCFDVDPADVQLFDVGTGRRLQEALPPAAERKRQTASRTRV